MEGGARLYDYQSNYLYLSALEGGIAYLDGDGTYLTLDNSLSFQRIYAYYGAIIYAANGATGQLTNNIEGLFCESYEGTIAYLTNRARLLINEQVKFSSMTANKGSMIFAANGCQFWLDSVTLTNCKAGYEASIINIENGREQYHLVNGQTRIAYGVSYYLKSYIHNSVITRSDVEEKGRLISVSAGALFLNHTNIYGNEEIDVDNYGIAVFSGEVQIFDSTITGRGNNAMFSRIYQKSLKEVYGAFLAAYGTSKVEIRRSTLENGRGENGGCVALFGSAEVVIEDSEFKKCYAMQGGAIYAESFKSILIKNTNFKDNFAY